MNRLTISRKPRARVTTACVADRYAVSGQKIIEFTFPDGSGGLISFHTSPNGTPYVALYQMDPSINVGITPSSGNYLQMKRRPLGTTEVVTQHVKASRQTGRAQAAEMRSAKR